MSHVGSLLRMGPRRLVGLHPNGRHPVPLRPLGTAGQFPHRMAPGFALPLADHWSRDQLSRADFHVPDGYIARRRQEAVLTGDPDLAAALTPDAIDLLTTGTHDPCYSMWPERPVSPHRHDLT